MNSFEIKLRPLSVSILSIGPNFVKNFFRREMTVFVSCRLVANATAYFKKWSIIDNIWQFPCLEVDIGPMKSITSNSKIRWLTIGCSGVLEFSFGVLNISHFSYCLIYHAMIFFYVWPIKCFQKSAFCFINS